MMQVTEFRFAGDGDMSKITVLLKESKLPSRDIGLAGREFLVATEDGEIIGVVGLEAPGKQGLLRSLAVEVSHRNKGLGRALLGEMTTYAGQKGVEELYLLTTTADKFFSGHGFETIDRTTAPAALQETLEFKSICPVSAICMKKKLV